jgi:predicted nucleic acid-binding protein
LKVFIDSNIPMYVAGRDHLCRDPSRRFLEKVRAGEVDACTSTEVLQEILWRYAALKRIDLAASVYDLFVQICPQVLPITIADTDRARQILTSMEKISARDALHAAVMLNHSLTAIATFDQGFDAIGGISRIPLQ